MKIAYQGIEGSYSESCSKDMYPDCKTIPCKTFDDVFKKASEDEEIRAIIHVIGIYCGVPQALECFRVAKKVLEEENL